MRRGSESRQSVHGEECARGPGSVSTILTTGFEKLNGSDVSPGGVLDVVASRLSKTTGVAPELIRQYAHDGGSYLRAVVQTEADLTKAMLSAAGRRSA